MFRKEIQQSNREGKIDCEYLIGKTDSDL